MLANIGREQIRKMGKYLHSHYGDEVGIIYHSNSMRAKETTGVTSTFFPGVKLFEDPNLAEGVPIYPSPPLNGFDPKLKGYILTGKELLYSKHTPYKRVNTLIIG
ncbi:phosphoglycerate mutase family [Cryptosporidium bovis]|uniref:phosphoglycerate mutase family n=1 Tax=Cryptosporidium bovis TaxID=310047 RepID=UPI00351AAB81|nr:phosphoglycerate mutase family [Cryptosporidium bovis]